MACTTRDNRFISNWQRLKRGGGRVAIETYHLFFLVIQQFVLTLDSEKVPVQKYRTLQFIMKLVMIGIKKKTRICKLSF